MKIRMCGVAIAAGTAFAGSAIAAPILLDDFTSGAIGDSIAGGSSVNQFNGTMLGGQVDVGVLVTDNPFDLDLNLFAVDGLGLSFATDSGVNGRLLLDYDGADDVEDGELPLVAGTSLGADLTGQTDLFLDFVGADRDFEMSVTIVGAESTTLTQTVGAGTDFSVGFDLTSIADLSGVTRVLFEFNTTDVEDLDFILGDITAVPAPGALMLLGIAGLAGRRRR